jgi:superfamily II RNA helicase
VNNVHGRLTYSTFLFSDIAYCAVVTAWANGCSWSEALELSGLAPGDLARTLSRVLDALRQIANLPYDPLRRSDVEITSQFGLAPRGFDPRLKDSCKRASAAINRYPLKDSLMFNQEDEEATEEEEEEVEEELENDEGPE